MYEEDEYLMLSGIQHYYFCKRQWCLIHIENQWGDNRATKEGEILHDNADNPFLKEARADLRFSRAMPVASKSLGFSGILDVVEFRKNKDGLVLDELDGLWKPYIVEYKHGKEKNDLRDVVQLVAEVISLEETLHCHIAESYLFYNKIKRRIKVDITEDLRIMVQDIADDMHRLFHEKVTLKAENYKHCNSCSLKDICMPRLTKKTVNIDQYIMKNIEDSDRNEL
jgi:CRISPR-associated exonuclease Cas4